MGAVVALLAIIGVIAASLARWTRFHPVAIAALGGVPGSVIGVTLSGEAMRRETWMFAVIVYVVTTTPAALGAFLGWLRRDYVERNA